MINNIEIDRKLAPVSSKIENLAVQQVKKHVLESGIPVYFIKSGTQDVLRIEFIFHAGEVFQSAPLLARTVNSLLQEGTKSKTGLELANEIDFYGAFLQADTGKDLASLTLYVAKKHLKNVLSLVVEILLQSTMPEKEFQLQMQNGKQKYKINLEKTDYLASKYFGDSVFKGTVYQSNLKIEDFETLTLQQVKSFYNKQYSLQNLTIVAAGMVDDEVVNLLEKHFNTSINTPNLDLPSEKLSYNFETQKDLMHLKREDSLQSSIRIGRRMFLNNHPDKFKFSILNCVLGGYFGSRLMANIREDKGYTYGISSSYSAFQHAAVFTIGTDVGNEVCEKAIVEIYKEIEILKQELIPQQELELVKSYLLGSFLKSLDGPFALSDRFKAVHFLGLNYKYYEKYIETIETVTNRDLIETANQYLNKDSFVEVVVGN
jgi:zinc protease